MFIFLVFGNVQLPVNVALLLPAPSYVRIGVNLRIFLLDEQEEFYRTSSPLRRGSLVPHLFIATFST